MEGRIFGLDAQLLADVCIQMVAIGILFALLSYLLFNPARELLRKRQEKIDNELKEAAEKEEAATNLWNQYDEKMANIDREAESILSDARRRGQKNEADIVAEAKQEAGRILARAEKEIELEKDKVKDEVKQEMITVAQAMAEKITASSMTPEKQEELLNKTLAEMGDDTWRS